MRGVMHHGNLVKDYRQEGVHNPVTYRNQGRGRECVDPVLVPEQPEQMSIQRALEIRDVEGVVPRWGKIVWGGEN